VALSGADKTPKAYVLALRWLTVRPYSISALRQRLQRKGCESADIDQALARCQELRYLDDERYATDLAAGLMRRGAAVGMRLLHELKKQGIDDDLAAAVVDNICNEQDEEELLTSLLQRRYAHLDLTALEQRQKQRIVNYLQRRGFGLAMILQHLK